MNTFYILHKLLDESFQLSENVTELFFWQKVVLTLLPEQERGSKSKTNLTSSHVITETGVVSQKVVLSIPQTPKHWVYVYSTRRSHLAPPPPIFYFLQGWPVCFCNFLGAHKQHFQWASPSRSFPFFCTAYKFVSVALTPKVFGVRSYWHLFSLQSKSN